jgi:hypothetical protein
VHVSARNMDNIPGMHNIRLQMLLVWAMHNHYWAIDDPPELGPSVMELQRQSLCWCYHQNLRVASSVSLACVDSLPVGIKKLLQILFGEPEESSPRSLEVSTCLSLPTELTSCEHSTHPTPGSPSPSSSVPGEIDHDERIPLSFMP